MAPTPVQDRAIPILQEGHDLFAQAQTGTGKTAAFAIPILDEADRLLDMGFAPEVHRLLRHCPAKRQTALFSATLSVQVRDLARRFTHEPLQVAIDPEKANIDSVEQVYVEVLEQDKARALDELLRRFDTDQVLVFRHTKRGVDGLDQRLRKRGHDVAAIHGG